MENKWKSKNFIEALKNTINGIKYSIKTQNNLRIELVIAVIVITASIILKLSKIEFAIVIMIIFLVLFAELINTAIEETINLITEDYNEKAKIVKDISAGAVTIVSISSIIIGIIIFSDKIIKIFIK